MQEVEQILGNWTPRFLADGCDAADLERILEEIRSGSPWSLAWSRMGEHYEGLAAEMAARGFPLARTSYLLRASAYYHFAQFMIFDDLELRWQLHRRSVACMESALPTMQPPGRKVRIPYDGITLPAILRLPPGDPPHPAVVLLPGLDSSKEELHALEDWLVRAGLATLSLDGPGQGETRRQRPWTPHYHRAVSAVVDWISRQPDLDASRIGVLGRSFGGYLSLQAAAREPRLRAAVDLGGPYDLSYWSRLQPLLQRDFAFFSGARSPEEAAALAERVSLEESLKELRRPILVVHGGEDAIFPVEDAERIVREAPAATFQCYRDGNHVCENYAAEYRPFVADWLRAALA
ncbi:MAG: alpha/beta fold hydrolase [Firmicutes bacterium]|nr:alpha/beta fold hydrolase [Bacillota bacterium]